MTRIIASALLIVGLATGASAQGIEPVTSPEFDVTVGTQTNTTLLALAGAAIVGGVLLITGDDDDDGATGGTGSE